MHTSYDVIVIGAGPSGLTVAGALARAGVRVLVVERHPSTSIFPKATGLRPRTMEILRCWGLTEQIRAGVQQVGLAMAVSPTLADPHQQEVTLGMPSPELLRDVSPATFVVCPQDHLELVLLQHLYEHGGRVRFRTVLTGFDLSGEGVTARLRGSDGETAEVHARFLVGADGTDSTVRAGLGIPVEQLGFEGHHLAVLFGADLAAVIGGRRYALHWVTAPGAEGMFVASGEGRWVYDRQWHPERGESVADWTPERCAQAIRAAAGVPELPVQVLARFPWTFGAAVAAAQRAGNAFLIGDAAHRTTPRGATGMNTGIGDAYNLGWKLAWVIRGWAGPALLDSYEPERRPVGLRNALRSLESAESAAASALEEDFGTVYRSGAIVSGGRTATPERLVREAVPGARAPHAWVRVEGPLLSTLELFDGRLTVLTGPQSSGVRRAADELATAGLPIAVYRIGGELPDPDGTLGARYRVGAAGAVLIRPDGHVAWHSTADAGAALRRAVAVTLGRGAGPATRAAGEAAPGKLSSAAIR